MEHPNRAQTRTLTAAGWIAMAFAAALLAWSLAKLFWTLFPAPETSSAPADPGHISGPGPHHRAVDIGALHLFGQAGVAVQPDAAPQAPETQLKLRLLGTFAAADPAGGMAIIADESEEQEAYRVGDDIPGNAELREVHADFVVIERQGRLESLRLEREAALATTGGDERRSPHLNPAAPVSSPAGGNIDWQAARNQARFDPARLRQLGQQIRALPYTENGQPIGVRLMAGSNSAVLSRLGLRSSDIVLSVNGIPLTDPSRQFELMNLLNQQSSFQVRVRRNGREMTLNIDASQLQTP